MIEKKRSKNKKALDVGRVSCFAWPSYLFKYMNFLTGNLSALIGFPKEATKIFFQSVFPSIPSSCFHM